MVPLPLIGMVSNAKLSYINDTPSNKHKLVNLCNYNKKFIRSMILIIQHFPQLHKCEKHLNDAKLSSILTVKTTPSSL
jgi:hypothetical protein